MLKNEQEIDVDVERISCDRPMHRGPPLLGGDAPTVFHYHRSPLGNWPEDQSAQLHQVGDK